MGHLLNLMCAIGVLTGAVTFATVGSRDVTFVGGVRPAHAMAIHRTS